jgi:paraquat-inducible protein B
MSKQASPTIIGGFVVGAVALVVAGVLIFGSGKFFTETVPAVMYFQGDIKGLRIGASLDFQGVQIGAVTDIKTVLDTRDFTTRIPVVVEFTRNKIETVGPLPEKRGAAIQILVERGMRAQLQIESMVTGQLFVQLDFHPEAPPQQITIDPLTNLPEIPTVPTAFQQVQQTVRKALEKIGELPLEEIVTELHGTLQGIDRLVNAPEVLDAVRTLKTTLTDTQQLVRNIDSRVAPLASSVTSTMGDISKLAKNVDSQVPPLMTSLKDMVAATRGALEQMQETLTSVNGLAAPNSPVRYELVKTLQELSEAARALRVLADYLNRYPNAVVFGRSEAGAQ